MTPARLLASRAGLTEGQVYTAGTGLVVAVLLLALGLPPLHDVVPAQSSPPPRSTPLALPGSPAVAAVIAAADPVPYGGVEADPGRELAAVSGAPVTHSVPSEQTAPADPPPPVPDPPATPPPTGDPADLRIAFARYASASGPLVPTGPPGAHLPVSLRLGMADKQSYLRLRGSGNTLRLRLSTQPGHQIGQADAVRACRIIPASWSIEDGSALSAAPAVDPIDCTLGRPGASEWTFELGGIDTRNGVALVPAGPSTGTFQITFNGEAS